MRGSHGSGKDDLSGLFQDKKRKHKERKAKVDSSFGAPMDYYKEEEGADISSYLDKTYEHMH